MTSSVVDRGHRVTVVPYQRQFKEVLAYDIKCSRSWSLGHSCAISKTTLRSTSLLISSVVDRGHRVTVVPYQRLLKGVLAY